MANNDPYPTIPGLTPEQITQQIGAITQGIAAPTPAYRTTPAPPPAQAAAPAPPAIPGLTPGIAAPMTQADQIRSIAGGGGQTLPKSSLGDRIAPGQSIPEHEMVPAYQAMNPNLTEHEAGKLAYQELRPKITAPWGSQQAHEQRGQQIQFDQAHPWGAPISPHPGTLGRLGHILGTIGNIAGDVLAPQTMAMIPQTQLGQRMELAGEEAQTAGAQKRQTQEQTAQAQQLRAEAAMLKAEQGTAAGKQNLQDVMAQRAAELHEQGLPLAGDQYLQELSDLYQGTFQKPTKPTPARVLRGADGGPIGVVDEQGVTHDIDEPNLDPTLKGLIDQAQKEVEQKETKQEAKEGRQQEQWLSREDIKDRERQHMEDIRQANRMQMFQARQDALTNATKTMVEAAPNVEKLISRIRPQIDQLEKSGDLGPGMGRWNQFWTARVGTGSTQFQKLRTDVTLLDSMLLRMHYGARGGPAMYNHFAELINSGKQAPDLMRAGLDEIAQYAQDVEDTGTAHGIKVEGRGGGPGGAAGGATPNATPTNRLGLPGF